MKDFSYKVLKGNIFKEVVKSLLEEFGYVVMPYGYENQFADIKHKISRQCSQTALRIRCSPDLLVYDDDRQDVNLVEIKMSKNDYLQISKIEDYQRYWKDALLVAVLNFENVFYCEEVRKLGIKGYYSPKSDFKPIQDFFPNIESEDLEEYRTMARKLLAATSSKGYDEE